MSEPLRIAMWSGPRNISTAMMRAFGNRPDTAVTDEPLYGYYLKRTGLDHPGREAVIASQSGDWRSVVADLCGPAPDGRPVWYQKHMAHHLLPEVGRDWLSCLTNCFLIREPREVVASYTQVRERATLADTGFPQQAEMFDRLCAASGTPPPVLDAKDVLTDPRRLLSLLCDAVGIDFLPEMLSWAAGPRPSDGIWGRYWYDSVNRSTGFVAYRPKALVLTDDLDDLAARCRPYYRQLHAHRLGQ